MAGTVTQIPGVQGDGSLVNTLGRTKRRLVGDLSFGTVNCLHYKDSGNGGSGLTDAQCTGGAVDTRDVLVAADAAGKEIELPSGTWLVSTNLTLSNCVHPLPGAKIKPASGVTVTLGDGYAAEDTQQVFDISAGGTIAIAKRSHVTPNHFGSLGNGAADDTSTFSACAQACVAAGILMHVPKGNFLLSTLATLSLSGSLVVKGDGQASILTGPNITAAVPFYFTQTSGADVDISGVHFSTFSKVVFLEDNAAFTPFGHIKIHDCTADNLGEGIISTAPGSFVDAGSIDISNVRLTNVGKDTALASVAAIKIACRNVASVQVSSVYIDGVASVSHTRAANGIEVFFSGTPDDDLQPILITGCTVKNINSVTVQGTDQVAGIIALGGIANIANCIVDTIVCPAHPTSPDGIWTECRHSNISNNTIIDVHAPEGAINLKNSVLGTPLSAERSIVAGNTVLLRDYVSTASKSCVGIHVGATHVMVQGNTIDRYPNAILVNYDGNIVHGNTILRCGSTNAAAVYGILHAAGEANPANSYLYILDNIFRDLGQSAATNAYACQFNLSGAEAARHFEFSRNRLSQFAGSANSVAVALNHTSSGTLDRMYAIDNVIGNVSVGMWLNGTGAVTDVDFSSNVLRTVTTPYTNTTLSITNLIKLGNRVDGVYWSDNDASPVPSTTTAALEAIGNAINTTNKFAGKMVWNATATAKPFWAVGAAAGDGWADATGTVIHTPV